MGPAWRNDGGQIPTIEIRAFDGTIIRARNAHVSPVDVTCRDVHSDAVR